MAIVAKISICAVLLLMASPSWGATPTQSPQTQYKVELGDLPRLGQTPSVSMPSITAPRPDGVGLAVPPGYRAQLLADHLQGPRNLLALPSGAILIALSENGELVMWNHGQIHDFAQDFVFPYGLALRDGAIYVADVEAVWRLEWQPGQDHPTSKVQLTPKGALGPANGHITRSLVFAPDGKHFYVGIGSSTNLAVDPPPRASILEFTADGRQSRVFASGLRNPVGMAFKPGTDDLWAVVNERDHQGDDMVPDYLTHVIDGGFYGWPYAWLGPHPQPGFAEKAPDKVASALVPDVLFKAHSAPLGLVFWRGDAFVALHGSWNRSRPQGYFIARAPFDGPRPRGGYDSFATGFETGTIEGRAQIWGRPVGLAVGADDALYLCDDVGGTFWRISRE